MHFSTKEKEIIINLATGVINDLPSYLAKMVPLKEEKNTWSNFINVIHVPVGAVVKMVEDQDALARELAAFIALCYRLQGLQVLQILENVLPKTIPLMLMRGPEGATIPSKVVNLFANNRGFEVVPFHELSVLINDGFLSADEKNLYDERKTREQAQRTTIIIAIVSLLLSTLTSVGITYFNYKTYSTDRKVSITNLDSIKYPIPVSISEMPIEKRLATKITSTKSQKVPPQ